MWSGKLKKKFFSHKCKSRGKEVVCATIAVGTLKKKYGRCQQKESCDICYG